MHETNAVSISRLVAIPALVALGVTVLRLVGELTPWFSTAAGGGAPFLASPGCA